MEFKEERIVARVPQLGNPTHTVDAPLTIRFDPLTGRTARIVHGEKLSPQSRPDLTELVADPPFCPFCESTIEAATGTFPPEITAEGRIRRGTAAVVPNVLAYSEYSSVGLYDTTRHFVDLPDLTEDKVRDLLTALTAYTRGVAGLGPMWHSINANYLPPAGSSLIHPHAQSAHDRVGTTTQRALVAASAAWEGDFWADLVEAERGGPRWIGEVGRVCALTPWAPGGFHEVWAVVRGAHDLIELTDADVSGLARVLSSTFSAYADWNLASLNWALYGGGPRPRDDYSVLLRIVSRSNPASVYRSDVTYFERLHDEAMIDVPPEEVANGVRARF